MEKTNQHARISQLWVWLLPVAFYLAATPAHADLILGVQSVAANAGTVGNSLEVTLKNTGAPVTVGGFSFEIVASNAAVTFTGGSTATTTANYIFAGNSFDDTTTSGLVTSLPGQSLDASDLAFDSSTSPTIGTGSTVGLGHILFNVSNSAPTETVFVALTADPFTSLSDPNSNPIPITSLNGGFINIAGNTSAVPEPASVFLMASGLVGCIRRRGRK
jgi:hypothetical protein